MPRRQGHAKKDKPWDRENFKTRDRKKRVGKVKESAKTRRSG
jgi:hypothetical protein